MVFFHKNQSGIVLNRSQIRSNDTIKLFVIGQNGLHYVAEYIPEKQSAVAMIAQKIQKLTNAELVHIQLAM